MNLATKFETIRLEISLRGVATLTLARPEKHNALSALMIGELASAARIIADDAAIRAVVLTGEGKSFCAGGDLDWMRGQFNASRQERMSEARALAHMLRALNELPKPLIGRINGQAFGGGLGMMAVCDVAVCVDTAKFGFTETRLGLVPATISPYCIARMGEGKARRVFMSARIFGAAEAVDLGLAAKAVPAEELDAAIEFETAPCLSMSPKAAATAKALARRLGPRIDDSVIEETVALLADIWESGDARAGVGAFFEKHPAHWAK